MLWGRLGAMKMPIHRKALCSEPGSVTILKMLLYQPRCFLPGVLGMLPDVFELQPDSFIVDTSPTFVTLPFLPTSPHSGLHTCVTSHFVFLY